MEEDKPKCPECLKTVTWEELELFDGMCETCTTEEE